MATEYELCFQCGDETGRAGASDDSIYSNDGRGPWCLSCYNAADPDREEGVTGPTLGQRILEAARDCDTSGEYGIIGAEDRLRALCARADAAERLAVADAAYVDVCMENAHCQDHEVQDTWELWCARRDARTAWRAIEGNEVAG